MNRTKARLQQLVKAWQNLPIMVIGDPMRDVYHFGQAERLSPEAPVPVFVETRLEVREGGAANVTANLEMLGADTRYFFPDDNWTEKHRYLVNGHQLLRVDRDRTNLPEAGFIPCLLNMRGVILSDYAKGWLTPELCRGVISEAQRLIIPVVVDPKKLPWSKFLGCTVICPNQVEAENAEVGLFPTVLLKQGAKGMTLLRRGFQDTKFPATARNVFDVTGAGDTVVATLTCALAVHASWEDACTLANLAAGHVVGQLGTAACSAETLIELIEDTL